MGMPGDRVGGEYVPYFKTKDGYRWEIYNRESGCQVYGDDGRSQYPTKKEASYNMPAISGYYVDKVYYG